MEQSNSLADDLHGQWQKQNIFVGYTVYTYSLYPENVIRHAEFSSVFLLPL